MKRHTKEKLRDAVVQHLPETRAQKSLFFLSPERKNEGERRVPR